ncbi:hypothetical protein DKAM_0645 [Desulfurococcus amylolyticus 1221n]|uniref:Uncharacterized protein n=1 Tax=Desulfurococcus amylolyticus (strain DSM 18924 / JCM 16383 / VKM B-2413 / 1221n) TaxID=490899 RepID=B8D4E0_DESA1|nr:hypothetical protein [Desulfurococcus amylolyticus]ACL10971.1 hypothetical protein DKAM_0645 [Desulfurococcus amylolyticus 1221n]
MVLAKIRDNTSENAVIIDGNVIEISLKPRKRMISLRVNEEDLEIIDKFVARQGSISRTLLLTRVMEALAEGVRRSNGEITSITLSFKTKSMETISIQLNLN